MKMTDTITLPRARVQQALKALEDLAESAEPECGEENCRDCQSWRPAWAAIAALKAALEQPQQHPARQRFDDTGGREEPDPVERLRFFCSLAMNKQDWLDVEAFFDDVLAERQKNAALEQPEQDTAVHMTHCNKGEFVGGCKYGEEDCPALEQPEQEPVAWGCFKSGELQTELIGTEADVDFWCKSDEVQMQGMVKGPLFTRPPRREPEQTNPWRDAVDHELSTLHMVASDDPRESVRRLIDWHCAVQIDPLISSAAQELIERGRREALEQPEQEPVAWQVHPFDYGIGYEGVYAITQRPDQVKAWERKGWTVQPLYTHPPRREWRGLTDEEISDIFEAESRYHYPPICATDREFARDVEAALKEKNT
ncbi:MAG: hypothetical protein ACOVN4_04385 [Bosea sp. (in: a-proteobacteria)]